MRAVRLATAGDHAGAGPALRRPRSLDADEVLAVIVTGGLFVLWWPLNLTLRAHQPLRPFPLLAHCCGMLAGYGVVVLLGLMSRWPRLEHGVGGDVLARWHARGGRMVLVAVVVHAWAAVEGWAQLQATSTVAATWHVLQMPFLMSTSVGTVLLVAVAGASIRAARRRLSYERWQAIHLLTYLAVALSFLHQLAGPDMAGHRVAQVGWALLYLHVFGLVIRHRFLVPLRRASRLRLRVTSVVEECPGVSSIVVGGEHLDELAAEPGQFFRWRFLTPDHWTSAHPFSLSAPPTSGALRLTVKALGAGSSGLQHVPVGTWVIAEGPYGALTAARRRGDGVLLVAGGVGITPLRSLFESLPLADGERMTLLYRARGREHLVFRDELDRIAARRGATVHYLLGDDQGWLTAAGLRTLVPGLLRSDVFLCGPPAMASAVRAQLQIAGVAEALVHDECFGF